MPMNCIEKFLRRKFIFKEIGWTEIGEQFTRYAILKSRWLNIYVHQLYAPNWHPECHDHPWAFVTLILCRGYLERTAVKVGDCSPSCGGHYDVINTRRRPGSILWRPATFTHSVTTPYGTSWSLIIAWPKSHEWGFKPCEGQGNRTPWQQL